MDSAGSGNFTTVQAAIDSWCPGGTNAGETPPFVINIKAGSGPYDERITLDEAFTTGSGNIVGDIVIKCDDPSTKVVLLLQPTGSHLGVDDGLMISQRVHNVTFRDIVFSRSLINPCTDEIVRCDENAANSTLNTVAFYNCVFTERTALGPMITSKAEALAPPPANPVTLSTSPRPLQSWNDPGESLRIILDNCVFYGGRNINCIVRLEGTLGTGAGNGHAETLLINNCLSAYSTHDCFNTGGQNQAAVITITGTDQKAGPLNCTAALFPAYLQNANTGHCITIAASGNSAIVDSNIVNIDRVIAYSPADTTQTTGSWTTARGVSGSHNTISISDSILNNASVNFVDITRKPTTLNRVTMNTNGAGSNAYLSASGTLGEGTLTLNDVIISGQGTKFSTLGAWPAGGIFVNNSCIATTGTFRITALGTPPSLTQTNVINDDPQYATLDGLVADFMDVPNPAFASAGTSGAALAGGADYTGPAAKVDEWSLF